MIHIDNKIYLTAKEICSFYKCDSSTLRHARIKKKLEYIKKSSKSYIYNLMSIELYFGKTFIDNEEEEIKRLCIENDCVFKKKEVSDGKIYVTYICSCGNEVKKCYRFKKGISKTCRKCVGTRYRKSIELKGHKLLNISYINFNGKYKTVCELECKNCGNPFSTEPRDIGDKCRNCYRKLTENEVLKIANEKSHKLLKLSIKDSQSRGTFQCGNCGNIFETFPWALTNRCKHCDEFRSQSEKDLFNMIDSLLFNNNNFKVIPNDREFLKSTGLTDRNLEIDIMIYKNSDPILAIEWNGEYWHSFEETKEKDYLKLNIFNKLNIPLIQVKDSGRYNKELIEDVFQDIKNILRKIICI
jgi:hypothetical protein